MASQPIGSHRPVAVTLLAGLAGVAGVLNVVDVLRYLGLLPLGEALSMKFYGVNWFGAFLAAIVAAIWFMVMRQLWTLDPRGWLFVVAISIFNLIFLFLAILGQTTFQAVALMVLVSGVALILAILPGTRAAFGQR